MLSFKVSLLIPILQSWKQREFVYLACLRIIMKKKNVKESMKIFLLWLQFLPPNYRVHLKASAATHFRCTDKLYFCLVLTPWTFYCCLPWIKTHVLAKIMKNGYACEKSMVALVWMGCWPKLVIRKQSVHFSAHSLCLHWKGIQCSMQLICEYNLCYNARLGKIVYHIIAFSVRLLTNYCHL